ncbi:MAG: hypothetical protein H6Q66_561 [Firmicutes bacterium]|nr:hypothetical protein [Bacillota bacterium]
MPPIVKTPEPPYYAVIFTSMRTEGDHGYGQMAREMVEMVSKMDGFCGVESLRNSAGYEITISYWTSLEAIKQWKEEPRHLVAQKNGKELWYKMYASRVCRVERDSFFHNS